MDPLFRVIKLPDNLQVMRQYIATPEEADELLRQYHRVVSGVGEWLKDFCQACHQIKQADGSTKYIWTYYHRHLVDVGCYAVRVSSAIVVSDEQALRMINANSILGAEISIAPPDVDITPYL